MCSETCSTGSARHPDTRPWEQGWCKLGGPRCQNNWAQNKPLEQVIGSSWIKSLSFWIKLDQVRKNLRQLIIFDWNNSRGNFWIKLDQLWVKLDQVGSSWIKCVGSSSKLRLGMLGSRGVPHKFRDTSTTCSNGWKHELHAEQLVPMGN